MKGAGAGGSFLPRDNTVVARRARELQTDIVVLSATSAGAWRGHGTCSVTDHGQSGMSVKSQILIVDDEEDSRAALEALLGTWGYATDTASQGREALEKAPLLRPSLVITDLMMPDMDGLALLNALQQEMPRVPVIILTGRASVDTAVGAMRQGAYDYLTKPVDLDRLRLLVEKALDRARTLDEITILRRRVKDVWGMGRLIGRSAPMQEVHRLIEQAAATSAPVLIHGETGTGKELVARTLHDLSARAVGPFVAVNCAAMPETLLESEIFGHERGAFTDARDRRAGLLPYADGGTVFLDEVGELPLGLQPRLLRALQERVVRPVGSNLEVPFDVRVVAASHRGLRTEVAAGRFRQDLFYRLAVVEVELPPLRERGSDILSLAQLFLRRFARLTGKHVTGLAAATADCLLAYRWPGNVRELQNTIERAVILTEPNRPVSAAALGLPSPGGGASGESLLTAEPFEFERVVEESMAEGNGRSRRSLM